MSRVVWLVVFCIAVFLVLPAQAQNAPGDSCSISGAVSPTNKSPAHLLVCNGSTMVLGESFSTAGLIGSGTSTPTSLLHVVGSGAKAVNYVGAEYAFSDTSSTASVTKTGVDIQSTGTWNGTSAVNIGLNVNATGSTTTYAAIFNGGNVGVGTTTPNYALDVYGASAGTPCA